jgi:hypothetical protein
MKLSLLILIGSLLKIRSGGWNFGVLTQVSILQPPKLTHFCERKLQHNSTWLFTFISCTQSKEFMRFKVLTVVNVKKSVFWDMTPCSLIDMYQSFGGTCCLDAQGTRVSYILNNGAAGSRRTLPPIYQAILHQIPENHDINNGFFTL